MSWGVLMGLLAALMMQNGFFWYCAPIVTSDAPFLIALLVMSGAEMHTIALPAATTESCATPGPPDSSVTFEKPASL
jgi:hypothetical protein